MEMVRTKWWGREYTTPFAAVRMDIDPKYSKILTIEIRGKIDGHPRGAEGIAELRRWRRSVDKVIEAEIRQDDKWHHSNFIEVVEVTDFPTSTATQYGIDINLLSVVPMSPKEMFNQGEVFIEHIYEVMQQKLPTDWRFKRNK